MKWNDKLKIIRDLLLTVSKNVYHYARPERKDPPFIIWAEDGDDSASFMADNRTAELTIHGTIDFFTKTEFDATADAIIDALDASDRVTWHFLSVQYEEETELIHHEWEFWVN